MMGDSRKLYICMEGVRTKKGKGCYYTIHTLKLSDLTTTTPLPRQPTLFQELRFKGYPSMGCGFYDSKIVFAGGKLPDGRLHDSFISFDMITQGLYYEPRIPMQHGKLKPLVYQLEDRLYVMDTKSEPHDGGTFEYFNPTKGEWYNLSTPMDGYDSTSFPIEHSYGYPSVVLGNTCYLTTPYHDSVFIHHPSVTYKSWLPKSGALPFSGVATHYQHDSIYDSVIISFTKGDVVAHQFDMSRSKFKNRQHLFTVQSSTNLCGYFADFGDGIFSLTASDSDLLYVYTFKIDVVGVLPEKGMDLSCSMYTTYKYPINALCPGLKILGVVGCFPPTPNYAAKERAAEIFDWRYQWFARRYDENPRFLVFNGKKIPVPEFHRDGVLGLIPIEECQIPLEEIQIPLEDCHMLYM